MNTEELKKLNHDLRRPFSNLQMLITILKGSDMEKQKLISSLEKIVQEGQDVIGRFEDIKTDEK